mmetsp:Transcript_25224/g.72716  ORF Transcript_25224/g.72716 Transcript_25224/m.72716 type:complete len:205 (+) Transcript_25224:532-1146(+)
MQLWLASHKQRAIHDIALHPSRRWARSSARASWRRRGPSRTATPTASCAGRTFVGAWMLASSPLARLSCWSPRTSVRAVPSTTMPSSLRSRGSTRRTTPSIAGVCSTLTQTPRGSCSTSTATAACPGGSWGPSSGTERCPRRRCMRSSSRTPTPTAPSGVGSSSRHCGAQPPAASPGAATAVSLPARWKPSCSLGPVTAGGTAA